MWWYYYYSVIFSGQTATVLWPKGYSVLVGWNPPYGLRTRNICVGTLSLLVMTVRGLCCYNTLLRLRVKSTMTVWGFLKGLNTFLEGFWCLLLGCNRGVFCLKREQNLSKRVQKTQKNIKKCIKKHRFLIKKPLFWLFFEWILYNSRYNLKTIIGKI